jgi:UDP-N-acetylglucosamine--N-acetylmuramyl-(pentapeptide) pyrophosphoryl-undecaprenol N-acetylglucosamine transferase
VLFAGGGTGGHLYPALAVAQHLRAHAAGFECAFLGTAHGLEARLVPQHGFALHLVPGSGFRRMGPLGRLRFVWTFLRGLGAALAFERRWRPDVVVATGGYASLAAGLAAGLLGRPLLVQEQNSIPGLTNRLLGRLAREVHVAFPGAERWFGPRKVRLTGNPLRAEILAPAAARYDLPAGVPVVLVVGGSRGARSINNAVADAIPRLAAGRRLVWLWQTGELDHERLAPRWSAAPDVVVRPYLDDVAAAYAVAALVVCRAGAMTLAEITATGKAAILVPFPGAVDDHQTANARTLVDAGAALLLPDAQLSGARLAGEIDALLAEPGRLQRMRERSLALARPRATEELAAAVSRQAGREPREEAHVRAGQ